MTCGDGLESTAGFACERRVFANLNRAVLDKRCQSLTGGHWLRLSTTTLDRASSRGSIPLASTRPEVADLLLLDRLADLAGAGLDVAAAFELEPLVAEVVGEVEDVADL